MNNLKKQIHKEFDEKFKLGEDFWSFDCGDDSFNFEYTEKAEELKEYIYQVVAKERSKFFNPKQGDTVNAIDTKTGKEVIWKAVEIIN